jgi:tRNA(Arg) A34 adenosine deaminase TadA
VTDDRSLMRLALDEAPVAADRGDPGFGAVVARAGQILARASSTEITDRNPLAHDGLAILRGAVPSRPTHAARTTCDKAPDTVNSPAKAEALTVTMPVRGLVVVL